MKENGYIGHVHITLSNKSKVRELAAILTNTKIYSRLYADKDYALKENKALLNAYGIKNGIMEKAQENKPLTSNQKNLINLSQRLDIKLNKALAH